MDSGAVQDRARGALLSRLSIQVALGLLGVSIAVFAWWRIYDVDRIDAWMPNIITGLLTVAAITVVEWIIRQEAAARMQPRFERATTTSYGGATTFPYASVP